MKIKIFLLEIILFHILIFSTIAQVQAANYSLGMKKGTEIILEVEIFDKDGLKDVFGDGWKNSFPEDADEVGMKYKIVVKAVDTDAKIKLGILGSYDAFLIEADIWEWTDEEFEKEADEDEFEIVTFKDPEDINDAYKTVGGYAYDIILPFVPIDVVKFLDKIDEWKENDHEEWKTEGNTVIHDSIFQEETFVETFTYDTDTGFLVEYKIMDEDGAVIYKYGQSKFIPGYEIPLILGIAGISIIGLIYIMKRKI